VTPEEEEASVHTARDHASCQGICRATQQGQQDYPHNDTCHMTRIKKNDCEQVLASETKKQTRSKME